MALHNRLALTPPTYQNRCEIFENSYSLFVARFKSLNLRASNNANDNGGEWHAKGKMRKIPFISYQHKDNGSLSSELDSNGTAKEKPKWQRDIPGVEVHAPNSSDYVPDSSFKGPRFGARKQVGAESNGGSKKDDGQGGSLDADNQWKNVFPPYRRNAAQDREKAAPEVEAAAAKAAAAAASASAKELESHVNSFTIPNLSPSISAPPCSSAQRPTDGGKNLVDLISHDPIWAAIRAEARLEAEREPILSSFLYASILAHPCFERSLGFVLANRLKNATLLATQLMDVFDDVFMHETDVRQAIRLDVQAVKDRDPSCRSYSSALLYLKGYHALQSYRVAHTLWNRDQKVLALALQSRISEVFAVDIHPAAQIGKAIMLDHGTGVVIGETCVIGDRVSMLQGVTLGGTGKEAGDRHPKIGEGVLIGAGATILGNIKIGRGAMVAAGSLVLKDVPPHSVAAGTPANVIGILEESNPALTMKHDAMRGQIAEDQLYGGAGI